MSVILMQKMPGFVHMKPATEIEVKAAEEHLGVHFSDEYKQYLMAYGAAAVTGHELTGICGSSRLNVVSVTESMRECYPGVQQDLYVLEDTHYDDIVVWQDTRGMIYATNASGNPQKIADSMIEYITKK